MTMMIDDDGDGDDDEDGDDNDDDDIQVELYNMQGVTAGTELDK